ncbi:hypothetical protein C0Z16_06620 [Paraburkholderia rhynchosiae]|uniref:Uncharacterized protein n=1 Tax=Paraburkholderia rhynchosiae TaxID=487049 RepID=A0ABX4VCM8_9BURK|nr:hypothetical protein C0Z16_06620 [Paraburkholderia rhynchosiae]
MNVRGVLWGGAAIAIGIMIVVLAAWLLWQRWGALSGAQTYGGPNAGNVPQVSPPALQSAPRQERAQYEAQKRKLLESWEWIDQQRGIARIPVEEAMRIMANPNQGQNGKSADVRKESP